jgi:hypothetical protein
MARGFGGRYSWVSYSLKWKSKKFRDGSKSDKVSAKPAKSAKCAAIAIIFRQILDVV